jgi:hypothetical protein
MPLKCKLASNKMNEIVHFKSISNDNGSRTKQKKQKQKDQRKQHA